MSARTPHAAAFGGKIGRSVNEALCRAYALCDVAAPSEANKQIAIVAISARVRPKRSATQPKIAA